MKKISALIGALIPSKAWAWGIAIIGSAVIGTAALTIDMMQSNKNDLTLEFIVKDNNLKPYRTAL